MDLKKMYVRNGEKKDISKSNWIVNQKTKAPKTGSLQAIKCRRL